MPLSPAAKTNAMDEALLSREPLNIGTASDRELAWSVGILLAFVLSALLLAVMNRISPGESR